MLAMALNNTDTITDITTTDTTQNEPTTYNIPVVNIPLLEVKIDKFNNKCKKLGFSQISIITHEKFAEYGILPDGKKTTFPIEYAKISITGGELPVIQGWSFVASAERLNSGIVINSIPGENYPDRYRNNLLCEHCQSNRQRKYGYIIKNQHNHYMEVGKACLKDFFGKTNPETIIQYMQWLTNPNIEEYTNIIFDGSGKNIRVFEPLEFLSQVSACINQDGFFRSRTKSQNEGGQPTSDYAYDCLTPSNHAFMKRHNIPIPEITEQDEAIALTALTWSQNLSGELNDYQTNINILSSEKYIKSKHLGYIASIIPAYHRHIEEQNKKSLETANIIIPVSEFIGSVKDKITVNVNYENYFSFDTMFGTTWIHKFRDNEGNVYIWKTNKALTEIEKGNNVTIKGTIKEHNTYGDEKQTILTRCKIS